MRRLRRAALLLVIYFKSCPRCLSGDMAEGSDTWGAYKLCVQCGWREDIDHDSRSNLRTVQPARRGRQRNKAREGRKPR